MCTLKFGKCCLRSISGGGGTQVIVALSHPERRGGSPFSSKPSPPCSDPRRRIQEAWTSLLPPLKGAEKKPKLLMEQENVGMRQIRSKEDSGNIHSPPMATISLRRKVKVLPAASKVLPDRPAPITSLPSSPPFSPSFTQLQPHWPPPSFSNT